MWFTVHRLLSAALLSVLGARGSSLVTIGAVQCLPAFRSWPALVSQPILAALVRAGMGDVQPQRRALRCGVVPFSPQQLTGLGWGLPPPSVLLHAELLVPRPTALPSSPVWWGAAVSGHRCGAVPSSPPERCRLGVDAASNISPGPRHLAVVATHPVPRACSGPGSLCGEEQKDLGSSPEPRDSLETMSVGGLVPRHGDPVCGETGPILLLPSVAR
ncbi:hypothetical protein E2C01_040551 [Portunus trituberculatus]|uniref:Secreted protein n=1 Tax=Portunus trituberculatus TaxID=210409 RepID=A0A5B7FHR2_PORTR|nr:hypothetical protein [Portunus trituberculatus]